MEFRPDPKLHGISWHFFPYSLYPLKSTEFHLASNFPEKGWKLINLILKITLLIIVLVFDWSLSFLWSKSPRNATYCIDFNTITRMLNTPVSAKMPQGRSKLYTFLTKMAFQIGEHTKPVALPGLTVHVDREMKTNHASVRFYSKYSYAQILGHM